VRKAPSRLDDVADFSNTETDARSAGHLSVEMALFKAALTVVKGGPDKLERLTERLPGGSRILGGSRSETLASIP
jgi:hypothetical protein